MDISPDKIKILGQLKQWFFKSKKPYVTVGGYAGTGKTTLIALIKDEFIKADPKLRIAFCSYTGKASQVLQQKLKEIKVLGPNDSVSTIHSLIYSPIVNSDRDVIGWEKKQKLDFDLIIVDEASMVSQNIWQDLLNYRIGIIAVGDHGQLPPINDKFNLMGKPEFVLTEIHRQKSGNPILDLSVMARQTGEIPYGKYSSQVYKFDRSESDSNEIINDLLLGYDQGTLVLCGFNSTRNNLNNYIRKLLEIHSSEPVPGDRVICLYNNHKEQIFNGMLGNLVSIEPDGKDYYLAEIDFDYRSKIHKSIVLAEQFNQKQTLKSRKKGKKQVNLVDFGYALTVHKAQGSQARKVILFEERMSKMDDEIWKKWLYTAVTRAEEELYIIG